MGYGLGTEIYHKLTFRQMRIYNRWGIAFADMTPEKFRRLSKNAELNALFARYKRQLFHLVG